MDLANREIVGYAISKTPDVKLAKKALTNTIAMH
jgi:transposase InsO family protein